MRDAEGKSWSLRPVTEDDLDALAEIESRVHVAPWKKEHFAAELDKPYAEALVFTDDETDSIITGYIMVHWPLEGVSAAAQVLNVAVDLPYRGRGFAKEMLRQIAQVAGRKEVPEITLEVRRSNMAAIQLYQRIGFNIRQIRRHFYSNGEDAYTMVWALEGDPLRITQ